MFLKCADIFNLLFIHPQHKSSLSLICNHFPLFANQGALKRIIRFHVTWRLLSTPNINQYVLIKPLINDSPPLLPLFSPPSKPPVEKYELEHCVVDMRGAAANMAACIR